MKNKKEQLHLLYQIEVVTDIVNNSELSYSAIYLILYDALKTIKHPIVKDFELFRLKDYEVKEATHDED